MISVRDMYILYMFIVELEAHHIVIDDAGNAFSALHTRSCALDWQCEYSAHIVRL